MALGAIIIATTQTSQRKGKRNFLRGVSENELSHFQVRKDFESIISDEKGNEGSLESSEKGMGGFKVRRLDLKKKNFRKILKGSEAWIRWTE